MPKEVLNISEFSDGMSTAFDSKDIADNVLHQSWGFDFSMQGKLKLLGSVIGDGLHNFLEGNVDFEFSQGGVPNGTDNICYAGNTQ